MIKYFTLTFLPSFLLHSICGWGLPVGESYHWQPASSPFFSFILFTMTKIILIFGHACFSHTNWLSLADKIVFNEAIRSSYQALLSCFCSYYSFDWTDCRSNIMMKQMSKVMKCLPWATHSNSAFSPARAWTSPSCRATTRGGTGEKYGGRQSNKYWGKVHFKGNARKESQEEFLMICGTHLERRDGEQALLGLPSCSAEINNIHLSWKYD